MNNTIPKPRFETILFIFLLASSLTIGSLCCGGSAGMNQTPNMTPNMTANMTAGPQGPPGADNMTMNQTPGLAATIDVNFTFTGAVGSDADVVNVGNINAALLDFTIPQGMMNQTPNQTMNQTVGATGATGSSGGYLLYFNHTPSPDTSWYEELAPIPAGSAEDDESVTVKLALGEVLIDNYTTITGVPGVSVLPAGLWQFRTWHYVDSAAGTTNIVFKVYNRTVGGTETLLFTATSDEINALTTTEYVTYYVQTADYLVSLTDRLVIKLYGQSTHPANIALHFVYEGNVHTSHVQTPLFISDPTVLSFSARADGTDIKKGQAVYISGASGSDPVVALVDNTNLAECRIVGIMVNDTAANALGMVRRQGILTAVDTRGTNLFVNPNAEVWVAGDLLFATTTGGMTKTRPTSGRSVKAAYSLLGSNAADVLLIYPFENPVWVTAASNEGIVLRLGDSAGATNISFRDYANNQIGFIDSDGNVSFTNNLNMSFNNVSNVISRQNSDAVNLSTVASSITTSLNNYYTNDTTKSLFGNSLRRSVNNDYLSLIGGTGSTPYSGNLQLYGGDNVAMSGGIIMSVGNASGSSSSVLFSATGRTDTPTLSLNNNKISSLVTGTTGDMATNKTYVDSAISGGGAINNSYVTLTNSSFSNLTPNLQWTAWTPTLTWAGGDPKPSTTTARYARIGNIVFFRFYTFSGDSNVTTGLTVTLPVAHANTGAYSTCAAQEAVVTGSPVYTNPYPYLTAGSSNLGFAQFTTGIDNQAISVLATGQYEVA